MLKKFGLLIAFILSLAGCGKDTKTASADNKTADAPLVGCYADNTTIANDKFKISSKDGYYTIARITEGGKEEIYNTASTKFKLFEGKQNIEKAILSNDKENPSESDKSGASVLANTIERAILDEANNGLHMFYELKEDSAKLNGGKKFMLVTNMKDDIKQYQLGKTACQK